MVKIYIAAPLFSKAEKAFNEKIDNFLTDLGYETFLPQNDSHELSKLLNNGDSRETARKKIFQHDLNELEDSDIVLFIMDGRVPDEGACVEIGYAYALGKTCIGLKTDPRTLIGEQDNPMIVGALKNRIASNLDELQEILSEVQENKEIPTKS